MLPEFCTTLPRALVSFLLALFLAGCSDSTALLDAVEAEDVPTVVGLLTDGADPLASGSSRGTPVKSALLKVFGKSRREALTEEEMSFDLPKIAILREVMNAVRDRKLQKVHGVGKIEHSLQMGRFDPDKIMVATSYFFFIPNDGTEKVEFHYTIMETKFVGFSKSGRGASVPLGTDVLFEGYRNGALIEATRIEVLDADFEGDSWRTSAYYFHKSTMDEMVGNLRPEQTQGGVEK